MCKDLFDWLQYKKITHSYSVIYNLKHFYNEKCERCRFAK